MSDDLNLDYQTTDKDWVDFWNGDVSDDDFDMMLSQYGYEYTPKPSNSNDSTKKESH